MATYYERWQKRMEGKPDDVKRESVVPTVLKTKLTNSKSVRLILPANMNKKDFELLHQWIDLLKDATLDK